MKKAIICAFGLAVLATPAHADEYWVVQDLSTKRCSVIRVTKDKGFFGWPFAEAEKSMKTTKDCSSV